METITSKLAAEHFDELLDRVSKGETIVITRDGRQVGSLVPAVDATESEGDPVASGPSVQPTSAGRQAALARLLTQRGKSPAMTLDEVLSFKNEGRRY